jgi:hypothetical protein
MVYVKEQMGHSSIQVTVDLYGHLIPDGNKQAVYRLRLSKRASLRLIPQPRRNHGHRLRQRRRQNNPSIQWLSKERLG